MAVVCVDVAPYVGAASKRGKREWGELKESLPGRGERRGIEAAGCAVGQLAQKRKSGACMEAQKLDPELNRVYWLVLVCWRSGPVLDDAVGEKAQEAW